MKSNFELKTNTILCMNAVHCDTTYLIFVIHAVFWYAFGICHYFHTCSLSVVLFASISFFPSPTISVCKTPFDVFILTGCIVCIPSTQSTNICDSQMYVNTLQKTTLAVRQALTHTVRVYLCSNTNESPCFGQQHFNEYRVMSQECACAISVSPLKTSSQRKTVKIVFRHQFYRIIYQNYSKIMILSQFYHNKSFHFY